MRIKTLINLLFSVTLLCICGCANNISPKVYNVMDYGAKGDSLTIDSPAINKAISDASEAGGGTVYIPKGVYSCYSIRLASNVKIQFEAGTVIKAAQYTESEGYDEAEPNPYFRYQDFGHSHWRNSLIWGIGLENITICGPGYIDGSLLSDGFSKDIDNSTSIECDFTLKKGSANKVLALKECKNVILKDFTVFRGGHFALLATGVDCLEIENLTVDTNRDGLDIDCCKDVTIKNCIINSPWDDAIVMKASYALGRYKACENVNISGCVISGYNIGSVIDGTKQKDLISDFPRNPLFRSSGRIKLGTESSCDFKNICATDCRLEYCGGLHVESTDGAHIQNITFTNINIEDCVDSPIFVMIGSRLRSPEGREVGCIDNVKFTNITSNNARPEYGVIVTGYHDHYVSNIEFNNVALNSRGGLTPDNARKEVLEVQKEYPDPKTFGTMPSSGMYLRHVKGITFNNVTFSFNIPDTRQMYVVEDCGDINTPLI